MSNLHGVQELLH